MKEETKQYDYPLKKTGAANSNTAVNLKKSAEVPVKSEKSENKIKTMEIEVNPPSDKTTTPKNFISDNKSKEEISIYLKYQNSGDTESKKTYNRYIGGDDTLTNRSRGFSNYSIISNENEKSVNMYVDNDNTYVNIANNLNKAEKSRNVKLDNPAKKVMNFSKFSKEVLDELNFARTNPLSYAQKLEKLMKENLEEVEPGICILYVDDYPVRLKEGRNTFYEAINFLKRQNSLISLKTNEGVKKSAEDLVSVIILHDGSTDTSDCIFTKKLSDINTRMNKYGVALGDLNEIIDNGSFTPECVVLSFLLCDGNEKRRERGIIFNNLSKFAGVSSGITPSETICTVINFSEHYYQKGDIIPSYLVERYQVNQKLVCKITKNNVNVNGNSSAGKFYSPTEKIEGKENELKETIKIFNQGSYSNGLNNYNNYNNNTVPIQTFNYETDPGDNNLNTSELVYSKPKQVKTLNAHRGSEINFDKIKIEENTISQDMIPFNQPNRISNGNMKNIPTIDNQNEMTNNITQSEFDTFKPASKLIEPIKTLKGNESSNLTNLNANKKVSKYQVLTKFNLKEPNSSQRSKSPEEKVPNTKNQRKSNFGYINYNTNYKPVENNKTYEMTNSIPTITSGEMNPNPYPSKMSNNKYNPIVQLDLESEENVNLKDKQQMNPLSIPLNNINNIYNTNYYLISSAKNNNNSTNRMGNSYSSSNRFVLTPSNQGLKTLEREFIEYEVDVDLKNIQKLPEKVESIKMIEKPLNENSDSRIVKKVINFKDGTSEVLLYQK